MIGACVHCGQPTSLRVKTGTTRLNASLLRRCIDAWRYRFAPSHWACVTCAASELQAFLPRGQSAVHDVPNRDG